MAIYPEITNRAVVITSSPEIIKRLDDNGIDPFPMSASQMSAFIAADYQRMGKLIKDAGITGD
jgi:tripartite-type tricarboxylate transporter receptor subunit TctC